MKAKHKECHCKSTMFQKIWLFPLFIASPLF